jgi:enoyl-[acyl-carrier protein] reductase II
MKKTKITELFSIELPIIQGGMIWVSGAKLAAAVSNAGGLGLIGAGSMQPELLQKHIQKAKVLTNKPFGVNIPLIFDHADDCVDLCIKEQIPIVFTSAGSPKKYTTKLQDAGIKVVHAVSTPELAMKCESAGVDAVVAEGFEAGGHNGREELTTLTLLPQAVKEVSIPVIAAGGFITGAQILCAFVLGAEAVQMGTRFVASVESSAHPNFKKVICESKSADTALLLKQLIPVRLIKNQIANKLSEEEYSGASPEELLHILGKGRPRLGMFDGDLEQGELEVSQGIGLINEILSVEQIMKQLQDEYNQALENIC